MDSPGCVCMYIFVDYSSHWSPHLGVPHVHLGVPHVVSTIKKIIFFVAMITDHYTIAT